MLEAGMSANSFATGKLRFSSCLDAAQNATLLTGPVRTEIMGLLLQHGADPNSVIINPHGNPLTPLMRYITFGIPGLPCYDACVKMQISLLLKHGASLDKTFISIDPHSLYTVPSFTIRMFEGTILDHVRLWSTFLDTELEMEAIILAEIARMRRWSRLVGYTKAVGKMALFFRSLYEEVHYRPHHAGAKRAKLDFEALAASTL